jgi:adenosylcobinamide-GDP ribazoletransferase
MTEARAHNCKSSSGKASRKGSCAITVLDSIKSYALDTARAVGFLSRIRMPPSVFAGYEGGLAPAARAMPLAGSLIALPSALLFGLLSFGGVDPLLSALLSLCLQTLLTGALHEDGLSDTADGLGGGTEVQKALDIMKDSRIGTYGGIALIMSFALRAAALAVVARELPPLGAALSLPAAAALSRAALVWHWYRLPAAKRDGVAASAGQPGQGDAISALSAGLIISAILLLPFLEPIECLDILGLAAVSTYAFTRYVSYRIAGHTGDTIGATQQICEIAVFCALAMAL